MIDTPPSEMPNGLMLVKSKTGWRKKCVTFALVMLLAFVAAALAAFFFCPWYAQKNAGASPQDVAHMQAQLADADRRIAALESRIDTLSAHQNAPAPEASVPAADVAHLQSDLGSLATTVITLQAEVKQAVITATQSQDAVKAEISAGIAFIQLREAVGGGHPFTEALAAMRAATRSDSAVQEPLNRLDPYAAQGVPSLATLQEQLTALEPRLANAADKAAAQNWWQRILAEVKGLITVRAVNGNAPDAFAAVDAALARGDTGAALEAVKALPPAAQDGLAEWRGHLESRRAVDDALHALDAHYTAGAAP